MIVLLLFLAALARGNECYPVKASQILGSDLKAAAAGFEGIADDAVAGMSPFPGIQRVLSRRELTRLLGAEYIGPEPCFVRAVRALEKADLETAIRSRLESADIELEVLDFSRSPVPDGKLEFPLAGLAHSSPSRPDDPVVWRGRLHYDATKSVPVWAKVRLRQQQTWMEAAMALSASEPVRAEQLLPRSGLRAPLVGTPARDISEIVGRHPRRTLRAGEVLYTSLFADPPLVAKDETVDVEMTSGGVALKFEAVAQTSGQLNESIVILDPLNHRRIKGVVTGKGKISVHVKEENRSQNVPSAARAGVGIGRRVQ